jgi:hypothetical protein
MMAAGRPGPVGPSARAAGAFGIGIGMIGLFWLAFRALWSIGGPVGTPTGV